MAYQVRETGDGFAVCSVLGNRIIGVVAVRTSREEAERQLADLSKFNDMIAAAFVPSAHSKA